MQVHIAELPNHVGQHLWCVTGPTCFPSIFVCIIEAYARDRRGNITHLPHDAPIEDIDHVCIWGHSRYRNKDGFRTLGVNAKEWTDKRAEEDKWWPAFFTEKSEAFVALANFVSEPGKKSRLTAELV